MTIHRRYGALAHRVGRRTRVHLVRVFTLVLASACASLTPPRAALESRVAAVLERRGLGPDALLVIDNLLRYGPQPPPATPPLVLELLARPLHALDASRIFDAAVPAALASMDRERLPAEALSGGPHFLRGA